MIHDRLRAAVQSAGGPDVRGRLESLVAAIDAAGDVFAQRCAEVRDWDRLFDEAFEQRVGGVLVRELERTGVILPATTRERVERRLAFDRLWYRRLEYSLQLALRAFREEELRVVVLKGVLLGERIYPDAALRPTSDLDLLTTPGEAPRARRVLERLGYEPSQMTGNPALPTHAVSLKSPTGIIVDLHYALSSGIGTWMPAAEIMARAHRYLAKQGEEAWILSPEDEFLYLAVHAARHRFTLLGWLYDFKLFILCYGDLDWAEIVARARSLRVLFAVSVAAKVFERWLGIRLPIAAQPAFPVGLKVQIAVFLTRPASAHRFYSAVVGVWSKVYRVMVSQLYQALFSEGFPTGTRFWLQSVSRSGGKLPIQMVRSITRSRCTGS